MSNFVEVGSLDYQNDDSLVSKTYHKFVLMVNNRPIGRVSNFTPPPDTRKTKAVRELGTTSFGRVLEQVPSTNDDGDYKIVVKRTEVWGSELETALGFTTRFVDLIDQKRSFSVLSQLWKGDTIYETWTYSNCWITSRSWEEYTAEGEAVILLNAEFVFTSKTLIQQG